MSLRAAHTGQLPPGRARATRRSTDARRPSPSRSVAVAASSPPASTSSSSDGDRFDAVVVGSGLGGLSCAALLAKYGLRVRVLEAHSEVGGASHSWSRRGPVSGGTFHFESGPSLFSGMSPDSGFGNRGGNPMAHVLAAAGVTSADLRFHEYDSWNVSLPERSGGKEGAALHRRRRVKAKVGSAGFLELLPLFSEGPGGPAEAEKQWLRLRAAMRPLAAAATAVPAVALRAGDPLGVVVTAGVRYLPSIAAFLPHLAALPRPFSETLDKVNITEPFLRNWLDLLCFLLCGLPASGTPTAEIAFMFNEWYSAEEASSPSSSNSSSSSSLLQFPLGGASAVAKALAASVERRGGVVSTNSKVESMVFSDDGKGRVVGVRLAGSGEVVRASKAVISNADAAGTLALCRAAEGGSPPPPSSSSSAAASSSSCSEALSAQERKTPLLRSFVHLHAGFDASGLLDSELDMHHLRVESWGGGGGGGGDGSDESEKTGIDGEQNVSLISIASVADPSLAPPGKHTLHAYYPATEPYGPWEELLREIERDGGLGKKSNKAKFDDFKEFRAKNLVAAAEEAVPNLRERSEIFLLGGPLTHERYLSRSKGSYGPGWIAGRGFPSAKGPSGLPENLFCVGDFSFPGVGVPAVAASGAVAASSIVGVAEHWRLLNELGI